MEEQTNKQTGQPPAEPAHKSRNGKIVYFLAGVVITLIVVIPWMYFASQNCPLLWWRH